MDVKRFTSNEKNRNKQVIDIIEHDRKNSVKIKRGS